MFIYEIVGRGGDPPLSPRRGDLQRLSPQRGDLQGLRVQTLNVSFAGNYVYATLEQFSLD